MKPTIFDKLPMPEDAYNVALLGIGFESLESALKADRERLQRLKRSYSKGLLDRSDALALIERLEEIVDVEPTLLDELDSSFDTLSSKTMNRLRRIKTAGAILLFINIHRPSPLTAFTIVMDLWIFPDRDLYRVDINRLTSRFRKRLYDLLPYGWSGSIIAFWEAEFEPNRGHWQFHLHGVAYGDALRALRILVDEMTMEMGLLGRQIIKKPHDFEDVSINIPDVSGWMTYMLKMEPKAHFISDVAPDGTTERLGEDYPPAEPYFSRYLLLLDKLTLRDTMFLVGASLSKNGFCYRRR